jgi:hypothetical protein
LGSLVTENSENSTEKMQVGIDVTFLLSNSWSQEQLQETLKSECTEQ